MGHAWDTFKGTRTDAGRVATHVRKGRAFEAFSEEWAREAYRLLAPGGDLVAFGAPRLYHRLACGLEEAGFYVSDALLWLYGQGFPKSRNVAMAIDKRAGVEVKPSAYVPNGKNAVYGSGMGGGGDRTGGPFPVGGTPYEPVTDEARAWLGFGTGLKPAWEGAAVARKPLACSSVAANVLEHGAGALNVDACRIPVSPDDPVHGCPWDRARAEAFNAYISEVDGHAAKPIRFDLPAGGRLLGQHAGDAIRILPLPLSSPTRDADHWRTLIHEVAHYRAHGHGRAFKLELVRIYEIWRAWRAVRRGA